MDVNLGKIEVEFCSKLRSKHDISSIFKVVALIFGLVRVDNRVDVVKSEVIPLPVNRKELIYLLSRRTRSAWISLITTREECHTHLMVLCRRVFALKLDYGANGRTKPISYVKSIELIRNSG